MTETHRTDESTRTKLNNALGELREGSLGNLPDEIPVQPHAGVVHDEDLRELLSALEAASEEPVEETALFRDLVRPEATRVAGIAVDEANLSQVEFLTGWQDYQNDVSGLQDLLKLENWLLYTSKCRVVYLADHMGAGKTDFAHLCLEVVEERSERDDSLEEAEIRTNIPSSEYQSMTSYPRFKDWAQRGSVSSNRWFLFDEASSSLSGYSHDREAVEQLMSELVKKARKSGVNLIFIGHTGKDLHPDLRRLSDYVEKPSLKTARVYKTVKKGEGKGHKFDLDRLPPTSISFDTADEAPWSWGAREEEITSALSEPETKRLLAKRAALVYEETDLSMRAACDALSGPDYSVSTTMLRNALEGEYGEVKAG